MSDELFKVGKISEEELKKLEEEVESTKTRTEESIIDKIFRGEYVEREYIVIDMQLPKKEWNVRKILLYVINQNEPLTIDVNHPSLSKIAEIIKNMKFARIKVRQLKVSALVDGTIVEDVSKDIDEVISVEEVDPLSYMMSKEVKYTIVPLRRGVKSSYYREDGVIKLIVSGNTINGMRLTNVLGRDGYTNVLLVPASIIRRNDGTNIIIGCWFMVKKKQEEVTSGNEIEKMVEEAEREIMKIEQGQEQKSEQTQKQEAGEEKLELELR